MPAVKLLDKRLSFTDIAMRVKEKSSPEDLVALFLFAWSFWYKRNNWMNEKLCPELRSVLNYICFPITETL